MERFGPTPPHAWINIINDIANQFVLFSRTASESSNEDKLYNYIFVKQLLYTQCTCAIHVLIRCRFIIIF